MAGVKTIRTVAVAMVLVLMTPFIATAAETPSLSRFPNIQIEFGSASKFTITPPQSNSDGTWSYVVSDPKIAAVSGDSIIPAGIGTTTITAIQAATSAYSSASITSSLTVSLGKPKVGVFPDVNVVFTPPVSAGKYSKYTLTPPYSNSTGAWTFTSLNPAVATISGRDVSILGIGEAPIVATQAATSTFQASDPVRMTFSSTGPAPVLAAWSPVKLFLKDSPYQITPPYSPSDGTWSLQLTKTDAASLSGNSLTLLKAGTVVVTAYQSKSKNSLYGATSTSLKITIAKNIPTVGTLEQLVAYVGEPSVEVINPTSNSTGTWSYSTSDSKIAKLKNGVIVPVMQGVVTVTAVQSATETFDVSPPVQTTLVIGAALPIPVVGNFENLITFPQETPIKVTPPQSTSPGTWSYKSANPAIVSSENGELVAKAPGLVLITASQARTSAFGRFEKTFQIKVGDTFTVTAVGGKNLITIKSSVAGTRVLIDDKPAKTGGNKIVAGTHQVKVFIGGLLAYSSRLYVSGLKKLK